MSINFDVCCNIIDNSQNPSAPCNRPLGLLPEIIGAFTYVCGVWLPFTESWCLASYLTSEISYAEYDIAEGVNSIPTGPQGVYLGTPTIVDGKALFLSPSYAGGRSIRAWDAETERHVMRTICDAVAHRGYKRIVTGLGSGDISVEERKEDMGEGAKVVAFKDFGDFQDWVLVREIR